MTCPARSASSRHTSRGSWQVCAIDHKQWHVKEDEGIGRVDMLGCRVGPAADGPLPCCPCVCVCVYLCVCVCVCVCVVLTVAAS
jgi:hypothetical protein